jgi:PIN domain nuclease of toxin-antitoxin system
MRVLLDTQVMLWWLLDDPRLGFETRGLLASSPCVLSVASIWEVAIRASRQALRSCRCWMSM